MTNITDNIIDLAAARQRLCRTTLADHLRGPQIRNCLCCSRPFVSIGPGNRVCTDCGTSGVAAHGVEGRSA
jgi:hypothetical protein